MTKRTASSVVATAAVVVSVGAPLIAAAYLYFTTRKSKIDLPQPPTTPFFGNILTFLKNIDRRLDAFYESSQIYGPTWTATTPNFSGMSLLMTTDPAIVEYVLKTNFDNYGKGPHFTDAMRPLLGDGIFNTDGDNWKWQRKVSSHIFTGRNFRQVIEKVVVEDLVHLNDVLGTASDANEAVDLHMLLHAFTLDSFGKIAFGISFNSLLTPHDPPPFAKSFDASIAIIRHLLMVPFPNLVGTLNGSYRELDRHMKVINELANTCIREKRKREEEGQVKERMDLLDLYMDPSRYGQGTAPSDKQLRDMVLNMILAGRDTTAQALAWTFYELTKHPDVVELIRKEAEEVLEGRMPSYNDIDKLKYTNAVFFESLRLHPSVPIEFKTSIKEDVLPGNIKIPPNTHIIWHNYTMGRLETLWGPDSLDFKPSRWIELLPDGTTTLRRESPYKWNVFNAGPRACLGQQMATFEAVVALVVLLSRFDVVLSPDAPVVGYGVSVTLPMKHGLRVLVRRRD
ncbi:hypothetical protein HDU67_009841 [Dinochytrium kinnereticum]|nr:hypothetical protein HDU67_009841 [Dinochytrium kinnereticum]